MMIGRETRLQYDNDTYSDRLKESVTPLSYRINTNQMYNSGRCLSTLGPRPSMMGYGVSTLPNLGYAEAQSLADLESIMTNRNVKTSKSARAKTNPENPLSYKTNATKMCNNRLDPLYTKLSNPPSNYRGVELNRFYNLIHNPQEPIFYDFAVNTRLEAKDNHYPDIPQIWPDLAGPKEDRKKFKQCGMEMVCNTDNYCPKTW